MWSLIVYFPLSIVDSQVLLEELSALCTSGMQQFLKGNNRHSK